MYKRQDLDCVGVLLIKKGSVRVYILSEDGREITLYRLYDGDICILSASCVLQSITFDVHIDAVSDCEFLQTNSCAFSQIMQENIYVEAFAYKMCIRDRYRPSHPQPMHLLGFCNDI